MKIAILTRTNAINFGTVLQAYALQRYLKKQGYEVKTVDDSFPRQIYNNPTKTESRKVSFKEKIVLFIDGIKDRIKYARNIKLEKSIKVFKEKNMEYFYAKELKDLNENFDVFISGSDQIWAYAAEPKMFPYFLLETIADLKIKASYAVSMGESQFPLEHKEKVASLLNRFDYLSVRENSSKGVLEQYTNKLINVSCDPVFLIDKEEWVNLAGKRKTKNNYVFCYFLGNHEWYWDKVAEVSKRLGCEVYVYQQRETKHSYQAVHVCSPTEFLNYVEFAEFIVTDSFHGLCFSLIFEKQFCSLQRFVGEKNNTQNCRLIDLLGLANLSDKFLNEDSSFSNVNVDYRRVGEKFKTYIQQSKQYIETIVKSVPIGDKNGRKTEI